MLVIIMKDLKEIWVKNLIWSFVSIETWYGAHFLSMSLTKFIQFAGKIEVHLTVKLISSIFNLFFCFEHLS